MISRASAAVGATIEKPDGYHPVTYDDGGKLLVHESSFRVVDNRPLR
jgi:hypothetical protein